MKPQLPADPAPRGEQRIEHFDQLRARARSELIDRHCYRLAKRMLRDFPRLDRPANRGMIALAIQDEVYSALCHLIVIETLKHGGK
jgi:hypothetical protein